MNQNEVKAAGKMCVVGLRRRGNGLTRSLRGSTLIALRG
jgi:hypothetical protein